LNLSTHFLRSISDMYIEERIRQTKIERSGRKDKKRRRKRRRRHEEGGGEGEKEGGRI
jgi:hypothetical protein